MSSRDNFNNTNLPGCIHLHKLKHVIELKIDNIVLSAPGEIIEMANSEDGFVFSHDHKHLINIEYDWGFTDVGSNSKKSQHIVQKLVILEITSAQDEKGYSVIYDLKDEENPLCMMLMK